MITKKPCKRFCVLVHVSTELLLLSTDLVGKLFTNKCIHLVHPVSFLFSTILGAILILLFNNDIHLF